MDRIKKSVARLNSEEDSREQREPTVTQETLVATGLKGVQLRDYQLYGVNWLLDCWLQDGQSGCILGDEMGLGKTLQTIAFLLHLKTSKKKGAPTLIISPLSVLGNWETEMEKFSPSVKIFAYIGDKEKRAQLREDLQNRISGNMATYKNKPLPFDVCVTSYEICLKDAAFLKRFQWTVLVVDEAHRLKNHTSLLHQELCQFDIQFRILLTGTPVQNNLNELYSLLSFVSPNVFNIDYMEEFANHFKDLMGGEQINVNEELHSLLKPFLLRRLKTEVVLNLPKKSEVVLSIGMSALQKKLYKAILTKDVGAFSVDNNKRTSLINILMQLRKCCCHPYIFPGIESEPFELGDHLIYASGKLHVLDVVLSHLKLTDHKVLLFSQFTTMLDIIQDYLTYKGYTYERLDGSVRGEERYLAINKFNESDEVFIFLLSTKAGGQGLNLMTADTVIFVDSDFNPQNDLQAAARAHRIGQTRPVKIIRLVTKNSVEEIILGRAERKMKLTNAVIEGGQFSNLPTSVANNANELSEILKFGLEHLLESEDDDEVSANLLSALGGSCNGQWLLEEEAQDIQGPDTKASDEENMYVFEGRDYSKETSEGDKSAFDSLIEEIVNSNQTSDRYSRKEKGLLHTQLPDVGGRKRRQLTEEEKEARRQKRLENAAKKAKLLEEEELRKAQKKKEKREKLWKQNSYTSCNIALDESDEDEDDEGEDQRSFRSLLDDDDENQDRAIQYVVGDVTKPVQTGEKDAIVIHCVDDSGYWGSGGIFSALSRRSANPEAAYELAGKMRDLALGDSHLVRIDDQISREHGQDLVALIVAQTRDRGNRISQVRLTALAQGLKRVAKEISRRDGASVHLPRLGHNTPNFNWYGTEKLIKKELAWKNIPTFVYYYPRKKNQPVTTPPAPTVPDLPKEPEPKISRKVTPLPDIFTGITVYFSDVAAEDVKRLKRYLIAFDGDFKDVFDNEVTHVVCSHMDASVNLDLEKQQKLVSIEWLESSIIHRRLMDEANYLVKTR